MCMGIYSIYERDRETEIHTISSVTLEIPNTDLITGVWFEPYRHLTKKK